MRLAVRLSNDTIRWIGELEKIYNFEFGGLPLGQGHVVSKAYHILVSSYKSMELDIPWEYVKTEKIPDIEIGSSDNDSVNASVTSLNLSDEIIDGIKEMQRYLPGILGGKRINTGYCIQLIVKAALLKNKNKI